MEVKYGDGETRQATAPTDPPANEWIDLRGSLTIHVRKANVPLCFGRPRRDETVADS